VLYFNIPVSPVKGTDDAIYDELAVFQEANILPQIVIHFK
jgi:hypothetical protein